MFKFSKSCLNAESLLLKDIDSNEKTIVSKLPFFNENQLTSIPCIQFETKICYF